MINPAVNFLTAGFVNESQFIIMKKCSIALFVCLLSMVSFAQDTFSIVAVDPETGEVGSAGASCVEIPFNWDADFLGVLFPGEGAINSQAYYIEANQNNATTRFQAGDTPEEIIDWLTANDVQNSAQFRQYGVVRIIDNVSSSAAHTGFSTDPYRGDLTGPTYSIQGNILLGPEILENMESNFLNAEGTLAEKLMAALQGANVVGADSRCADNGTSSLFAFLKVAQPDDAFESPSLVLGVDLLDNTGIEPIDSLQTLFDELFPPVSNKEINLVEASVYPVPAQDKVILEVELDQAMQLQIFDLRGSLLVSQQLQQNTTTIYQKQLGAANVYIYNLLREDGQILKTGKILFQ